jgi:hypothetical protein
MTKPTPSLPEAVGRELDALVAEKVMGWVLTRRGGEGKYRDTMYWNGAQDKGSQVDWHWHPSTDIAAAMQVVEKMFSDGWAVELTRNIDNGKPEAWEAGFYGGNERNGLYKTAYCDSLALAICRAALSLALGKGERD